MPDRQPDPNPDSRPREDDRGSIESIDRPATPDPADDTPDAASGAPGGTDGVVRNQNDDAQ